jgi:TonB family protein
MERRRRDRHFLPFLGLALLVHYLLLTAAPLLDFWRSVEPGDLPVEVSIVDVPSAPDEQKKRDEEDAEKDRTPQGQVVELPKPDEERHPDDARFLSENDSTVPRETRSRRRGSEAERTDAQPRPPRLAMRAPKPPGVALPEGTTGERRGEREGPPAPEGLPTLKELQPSEEQLRRAIGSREMDYLGEVDEGDETLLNSKRWRFASFFNRVKRQVAENWHPEVAYRRRDPYGNVYGYRDRMTILRVHLDPGGRIEQVLLERPSGVDFLDDEAMQAFRAAQPFPNPPKQLVDPKTGLISFRFGFIFEVASRPTFKVYRNYD